MSLLRRISLSRAEKTERRELPRGTSFNDLSMGAASWGDDGESHQERPQGSPAPPLAPASVPASPRVLPIHATPFGSAPAPGGFLKSPALSIPRTSVAHLLEQRLKTAECGTPRSLLDMQSPSLPTPRASMGSSSPGSPLTPRAPAAADASEPGTPRSPRTPGGRRRKSGKIDGMDYYEFCELIRSSSL
ncbi:hypothetical protein ABPG75_007109 [Micractinium tetrahymenae]